MYAALAKLFPLGRRCLLYTSKTFEDSKKAASLDEKLNKLMDEAAYTESDAWKEYKLTSEAAEDETGAETGETSEETGNSGNETETSAETETESETESES